MRRLFAIIWPGYISFKDARRAIKEYLEEMLHVD